MIKHKVELNGYNVLHFGIKHSSKLQNPAGIPYTIYSYKKSKKVAILCLEGTHTDYTDINGNTLYYNNILDIFFIVKLSTSSVSVYPATLHNTCLNRDIIRKQAQIAQEKIKTRIMHDFSLDETQLDFLLAEGYSLATLDEARALYLVAPVARASLKEVLSKQDIGWNDVFSNFPYKLEQTTHSFKEATLSKTIKLITIIDTVLGLLNRETNYDVVEGAITS